MEQVIQTIFSLTKFLTDQISIEAKITAVADIYDALTAERVYKPSRSPFSALTMLDSMIGKELDGRIVRLLQANLPQELVGRLVTLSSKEIATIVGINNEDAEHPLVMLDEQVIPTSKELFIERLH
jgi:HD-GYP domain-containing protein (c-di-GMP phosphodiesterase class II)